MHVFNTDRLSEKMSFPVEVLSLENLKYLYLTKDAMKPTGDDNTLGFDDLVERMPPKVRICVRNF